MKPKLNKLTLILYWIVFAVFIGYGFGWMAGGEELMLAGKLKGGSVITQGIVTSAKDGDFLNSPSVNYSYEVNGQRQGGFAHVKAGEVSKFGPNAPIQVMYLAEDPSKSGIDPEAMKESAYHSFLIAGILELIIGVVFLISLFKGVVTGRGAIRKGEPVPRGNLLLGVFVIGLMACVGLGMLIFGAIPDYAKSSKLADSSQTITAQITAVYDHEKGGRYAEYTFAVNGVNYHGRADGQFDYGHRGPLEIHYLPSDPNFSAADPAAKLKNSRFGLIFMIVWNLIVLAVGAGIAIKLLRGGG